MTRAGARNTPFSLLKEKRPPEAIKGKRIATGAMRREASTLGVRPRNDTADPRRAIKKDRRRAVFSICQERC